MKIIFTIMFFLASISVWGQISNTPEPKGNVRICYGYSGEEGAPFIPRYTPFVTVTDTTRTAIEYYCIGNHPNCWGGIGEREVGIDTLRIFRTYITIGSTDVIIDEKTEYVTEPKGGWVGDEIYIHDIEIKQQ